MKLELIHSKEKKKNFPFGGENRNKMLKKKINSIKNDFDINVSGAKDKQKRKRAKSNAGRNNYLNLGPKHKGTKDNDSREDLKKYNDNNIQTFNSDKQSMQSIYNDIKYNLQTLKTEVKDPLFDKNNMNNLSKYSTFWYMEEPKYQRTYYTLSNRKNEKHMRDILRKSEKFNKYNAERALIGIINKFKNKNVRSNEIKKYQQFSYLKRIPIKVAFGLGKSNNEIEEISNNYNFNKRLKQSKIRKIHLSKRMNDLYTKGYNLGKKSGLINYKQSNLESPARKIFVIDSSINKKYPKNSFNKEMYSVLTKHKILKNILPKEVDYNTKTSIDDIINSEIHPLLRHQKKFLAQNTNLISQELNVLFAQFVRLCQKKRRNGDKEGIIELETTDKFIEIMKQILLKNKVEEEKKDVINNEDADNKKEERKKYLLNKFRDVIILAYQKIKKFNIDVNIFYSLMDYNKNDPKFQMELIFNGQYLFKAIKAADIPEIIKVIDRNKYLVAYKDDFNQIPLHICAKRNLYQLIYFLLSRLSSIDSQDLGGRTPLMIAAQNNFFEFVTILLFEGANPTIKDVNGKLASDMTSNEKLRIILKRAEILYNLRYFVQGKHFDEFMTNGLDYLFKKELKIEYEDWINKGKKVLKDIS